MLRSLTILTILTSTVLLTACQSTEAVKGSSTEAVKSSSTVNNNYKSGTVKTAFDYNQWQWKYHTQRKGGNVR